MDILSKLKFRCLGCKKEIFYNDAEIHHKACCPDKRISKLKQIPKKDLDSIKNEYKDDVILIIDDFVGLVTKFIVFVDKSNRIMEN